MSETRFDCASGKQGRVLVGRLKPDSDVMTGLEDVCKKYDINSCYISCGLGLLKKVSFLLPVDNSDNKKLGIRYGEPIVINDRGEVLGMQGTICKCDDGNYLSHIHFNVAKRDGEVVGGHLMKGDNIVMATLDFVINEVLDIKLYRKYDEETDFVMTYVE